MEAARERVRHVFETFDKVVVSFSGGKDSLVCLHLAKEEAERRGELPLDVGFVDEEVIPDEVINFVDSYRREPWVKMRWLAPRLACDKFILGRTHQYRAWEPGREWVRPMPEWAEPLGDVDSQPEMSVVMAQPFKGRVAILCGIRAEESLTRFRSVTSKLNENYICLPYGLPPTSRCRLVKPVYDWSENDVMKWLHEQGIGWCSIYDSQHLAGYRLRVATPMHAVGAKQATKLQVSSPEFYDRVIQVFPEFDVQARYWGEYDRTAMTRDYEGRGWEGCEAFIRDHMEGDSAADQGRALIKRLKRFFELHPNNYPELDPPSLALKWIASGQYSVQYRGPIRRAI